MKTTWKKTLWATALLLLVLPLSVSAAQNTFAEIYEHYDAMLKDLIADKVPDTKTHGAAIQEAAAKLHEEWSAEAAGVKAEAGDEVQALLPEVEKAAAALREATELDAAREAFYELSKPLVRYLEATEAGEGRPVVAYCPMVRKSWLQEKGDITNPYYGTSMLACGSVVSE